jgi:hypothetical protein
MLPRTRMLPLLWVLLAAPAARADSFEQAVAIEPGARLRIELAEGDVDVSTHEAGEVRIEARARGLGASGVRFSVTREGDDIVVRSRSERWLEWLAPGPHVTVRAWVPRHLPLSVATRGAVDARDGAVVLLPVSAAPR